MKRIFLVTALGLLIAMVFSTTALAQSYCDTVILSTNTGAAGSTVNYSGIGGFGTLMISFDGVAWATQDIDGSFNGLLLVPADATPGAHTITFRIPNGEGFLNCPFPFTVIGTTMAATVPMDAYPVASTATTLPNTGLMLILPAAGLALGGLGAFSLRRHGKK